MKSLLLFTYKQPLKGPRFRWGVLCNRRDTHKHPLAWSTIRGPYRAHDPEFQRSRNIDTVLTIDGPKAFYHERQGFRLRVPFLGWAIEPFLK
jgi:hypothetical protein